MRGAVRLLSQKSESPMLQRTRSEQFAAVPNVSKTPFCTLKTASVGDRAAGGRGRSTRFHPDIVRREAESH
jgi:hypothetical protein